MNAAIETTPIRAGTIRVASLAARHVRIPLRKPIAHASHSRDDSENIVVECRLEDGSTGYGEGAPRQYVTGETIDTSFDLLGSADWPSMLAAMAEARDIADLSRHIQLPAVAGDHRGCVGNAARCAVETAILDAVGRRRRMSISQMLLECQQYSEILEPRNGCRYSGAITSKPTFRREIVSAFKMRFAWFKQVKVKVGSQGQDDPRRLRMFRRILGPRVDIRVDANEAWTAEEAVRRILELEPFRVSSIEQPVSHENFSQLSRIRKHVHTPIMLDESLCGISDAEAAIETGACDLFNIRLSKCGGLIPSLDLALLAHRSGLGYQLGCQIGETGILSAAGRHFACSVKNIRYLEGSYDQYLVRERLTRENISFEWRGVAPKLDKPGLGVDVDPGRLANVTVREARLHG